MKRYLILTLLLAVMGLSGFGITVSKPDSEIQVVTEMELPVNDGMVIVQAAAADYLGLSGGYVRAHTVSYSEWMDAATGTVAATITIELPGGGGATVLEANTACAIWLGCGGIEITDQI